MCVRTLGHKCGCGDGGGGDRDGSDHCNYVEKFMTIEWRLAFDNKNIIIVVRSHRRPETASVGWRDGDGHSRNSGSEQHIIAFE